MELLSPGRGVDALPRLLFLQAEDGIREWSVTGVQTCALPIFLPVVGAALVYDGERCSSLIMAALIILPQIVVALLAPWVGWQARSWGRRPLLLIAFGALPIRALLFALIADPLFLVGFQLLDGISGAILGV